MFEFKILIIVAAVLLLVAPERVPELARTLGKFIRMFNAAKEDMERTIRADMFSTEETTKAFTDTGESLASTLYKKPAEDEDEEEEEA